MLNHNFAEIDANSGNNIRMKYVFTLCLILVTSGCSTLGVEQSQNIDSMKAGMSEYKILSLLGMPDSIVSSAHNQDRWIYEFKQTEKKGQNLYVDFKDGELVKAGELSSRDLAASAENRKSGTCTRRGNKEVLLESLCIK